jgi:hypothetical protein
VTFAEGFLSAKASTRGKGPSPRVSLLSAKALNPVVPGGSEIDVIMVFKQVRGVAAGQTRAPDCCHPGAFEEEVGEVLLPASNTERLDFLHSASNTE